jgi:hypothetical protein
MIGDLLSNLAKAQDTSIQALQRGIQDGTIPSYIGVPMLEQKVQQSKRAQQIQAGMQAQQQPTIKDQVLAQAAQTEGGIDHAQSNLPTSYAGGGIVAFAGGGVPQDQIDALGAQLDQARADFANTKAPGQRQLQINSDQANVYNTAKQRVADLQSQYEALMTKAGVNTPSIMYRGQLGTKPAVPLPIVQQMSTPQTDAAAATEPAVGTNLFAGEDPLKYMKIIRDKKPASKPAPAAAPAPAADTTAPAVAAPALPSSSDYGGIDSIKSMINDYQKQLSDSTKDADKQKELSGWMALANLGLGWASGSAVDQYGHPVSGLQNLAKAGIPALQGYAKDLAEQRKEQQENLLQRMGLGIKGLQLGQGAQQIDLQRQQVGLQGQEAQAKIPLYDAQVKQALAQAGALDALAKYRAAGGGKQTYIGGPLSNATVLALEKERQEFLTTPKANQYLFQQLPPQVQKNLEKYPPGSASYQSIINNDVVPIWDKYYRDQVTKLQALGAKPTPQLGLGYGLGTGEE